MIGLVEVSRFRKVIPPVYDISAVLSKAVHQPVPSLPNVHCRRTFGAQQKINYCPLLLICPLGVVMVDESRTTWFIVCRAPNVRRQCTLGRLGVG